MESADEPWRTWCKTMRQKASDLKDEVSAAQNSGELLSSMMNFLAVTNVENKDKMEAKAAQCQQ